MNGPSGVYIPLITPFRRGEVDYAGMKKLADFYLKQAVHGLIPLATTGEAPVLSEFEEDTVVSMFSEEFYGRTALYFGLCGNDTRKMLARMEKLNKYQFNGYLINTPYYNLPSQEGVIQHFRALAANTDKEILMYNIPYRTGRNMENETIITLAQEPNIVGIKDSCGSLGQSLELIRKKPEGFSVLTGEDLFYMSNLCNGGDGGILASAHIDCADFVRIYDNIRDDKLHSALELWNKLSGLIPLLFREPNPAPLKYLLAQQNLIESSEVRSPLCGISERLKRSLSVLKSDATAKCINI